MTVMEGRPNGTVEVSESDPHQCRCSTGTAEVTSNSKTQFEILRQIFAYTEQSAELTYTEGPINDKDLEQDGTERRW